MKLEKIRLATSEEIEGISKEADLTPMCRVMKMGEMTGVWKVVNELDPVILNGAPPAKFYKFIWGVENIMRGAGVDSYYFNVPADDPTYHKIIEEFGGQRLSKQPDFRYKVNL